MKDNTQFELSYLQQGSECRLIAGADEAGRGPLAGDVIAAAVILDEARPIDGIDDSKKLSEGKREHCFFQILENAKAYGIARASVEEVDRLNILQASLLAMHRAVIDLIPQPDFVYVDGTHCPQWNYNSVALVKGDSRLQCIAAASILAKVTRDREMRELEKQYPGYGFASHKGYPTRSHLSALNKLGPCELHRRSFKPVAALLGAEVS